MALTETMLSNCHHLHRTDEITFDEKPLSFKAPFRRLSVYDGLVEYGKIPADKIHDRETLLARLRNSDQESGCSRLGYLQMEFLKQLQSLIFGIQPMWLTFRPKSPRSHERMMIQHWLAVRTLCSGTGIANAFSN